MDALEGQSRVSEERRKQAMEEKKCLEGAVQRVFENDHHQWWNSIMLCTEEASENMTRNVYLRR